MTFKQFKQKLINISKLIDKAEKRTNRKRITERLENYLESLIEQYPEYGSFSSKYF